MAEMFLIRNMIGSVHDAQSKRRLGGGFSDHMVVIIKFLLCCRWFRTRYRNEEK